MARKKDLAGLAALGALGYMLSKGKGGKGADRDTDTGVDVQPSFGRTSAATAPDMGEIRDEEGTLSKMRRNTETGEAYDPTGSGSSMSSTSKRPAATPSKPVTVKDTSADYGNEGRRSVKEVSEKSAYETPYDRMNRLNREAAQAKADTDAETRKLRSANPPSGRGVIDTSNVNPNTLLPYKKGGAVKKMASASRRGDGIASKGKTRGRLL
jgi:hypothetical protein